jgi:hypothetical protein
MSVKRLIAQKESTSLKEDAQRLTELRDFLSAGNNYGNRKRIEEITEELKRIEKRLAEVEKAIG